MPHNYQFRKLDQNGLDQLVDLAKAEGWNPGNHDAQVFYNTDPDGFYGYFDGHQLLGGGSIVSYGGKFGFMGFFIIKPEFRGQGIGRELWHLRRDTLLKRLEPGAAIGMDGVLAMQPFYQKGGFTKAFRDERYLKKGGMYRISPKIRILKEKHYKAVEEMDLKCFGFERKSFLIPWLTMSESLTLVHMDQDHLNGYVHIRKIENGYKIGPLFAENPEAADDLYTACLGYVPGEDVYLDIPVTNKEAKKLVDKYNAEYTYECARMYHGAAPKLPIENIYGITSFELG